MKTCSQCENVIPAGGLVCTVNGKEFCSVRCALDSDLIFGAIESQFQKGNEVKALELFAKEVNRLFKQGWKIK